MRLEFCIELSKRREDEMLKPQVIEVYDVYHLPIIKAYADKIDLVNTINRLVPTRMEIDPGTLVLAMVLDALSGRHPLYRIDIFLETRISNCCLANPSTMKSSLTTTLAEVLSKSTKPTPHNSIQRL
jgi:hypothetical protein